MAVSGAVFTSDAGLLSESTLSADFFSRKRFLALWRFSLDGNLCFLSLGFRLTGNGGFSPSTLLVRNSLYS